MILKLLFILFVIIVIVLIGYRIDKYVKDKEKANRKQVEDEIDRLAEDYEDREV